MSGTKDPSDSSTEAALSGPASDNACASAGNSASPPIVDPSSSATYSTITTLLDAFIRHGLIGTSSSVGNDANNTARSNSDPTAGVHVNFVVLSSKLQELANRRDENSVPGRPFSKHQAAAFNRASQSILQLQGYPLSTTITTSFNDLMSDAALASLLTSKLAKADSVVLLRDAMAKTQINPNILITVFDQPGTDDNSSTQQAKDSLLPSDAERSVRFKLGPDDVISDPAVNVAHFGSAAALTTVAASLMDLGTPNGHSSAPPPVVGRDTLNPAEVASRLEQLVILRADKSVDDDASAQHIGVVIQVGGFLANPISQRSSTQMLDSLTAQQGQQSLSTSGMSTPTKSPPAGDAGDGTDHTASITPAELSTSINASNTDLEHPPTSGSASGTSSEQLGRNSPSRAHPGQGKQQQQMPSVQHLTSPQGSPPQSTSDSTVSMYAPMQAVTPAPSLVFVNGTNTGHRVYAWQELQSQSGYYPPAATPAGSMVFLHQPPQQYQQSLPGAGMHQLAHASSVNGSTLLYTSVPNGTPTSSMVFQTPSAPMGTPMGSSIFTTPPNVDYPSSMNQDNVVGAAMSPFQAPVRYSISPAPRQQMTASPALFQPQVPANTPMQSMAILHDFFSAAPPSTPVASISHLASPSSGRSSPRTHSKAHRAPSPSRVASHLRNQFGGASSDDSATEAPAEPQLAPPPGHAPQRYNTVPSSVSMGSLFALGAGVSAPQNSILSLDHVTAAPHNSMANLGSGVAVNSSIALQNQILQQLQQQQLAQHGGMSSPGSVSPNSRSRSPSGRSRSLVGGIHGLGAPLASIGELSAASAAPKAPANSRIGSMVFPSSAQPHQHPHFVYGGDHGHVPLAPAASRVDNNALGGQEMGSVMMMPVPNAPPGSVAGSMYFGQSPPQLYNPQVHAPVMGSMMFPPEMLGNAPPNSRMGSMVFSPSTAGLGPGGSQFGSAVFGAEQVGAAPPNSRAGSMMFVPHYQVVAPAESQMGSVFLGPDGQGVAPPNSRMGSMMLADNGAQVRNHVQMAFKAQQLQPASPSESASPKGANSVEAVDNNRNLASPHVNVMHFNSSNVSMETMATTGDNSGSSSPGEPASGAGNGKKSPTTQPKLTPVSEEKQHSHRSDSHGDNEHSEQGHPSNQQNHVPVPQIVINPGTPAVLSTTSISSIPYLMRSLAPEHQFPSASTVLLHRPPPNSMVNIAGHVQTDEYGRPLSMEFAGNRSMSHATVMHPYPSPPPPSMYFHSAGDLQASFNTGAMLPSYGSGSHSAVAQHIQSMTNGLSLQQQLEYERRIHEVNMHLIRVAAQRDAAHLALAHMQDQQAFTMMQHQAMGGMVPMGSAVHALVGERAQRAGYYQQQHAVHHPISAVPEHYQQQYHSHSQDRPQHQHQRHQQNTSHAHKPATNANAATGGDRILDRLEQAIGPHLSKESPQRSRQGSTSPEHHSPPAGTTPKTVQMVGGVKVTKVRRGSFESNTSGHVGSEVEAHEKGQWRPQGMPGM